MVGDDDDLLELAEKLLETYTLDDILEGEDITNVQLVYWLLQHGLIAGELPHVV